MNVKFKLIPTLDIVESMPIPQAGRKQLLKQIEMAEQYKKSDTVVTALMMLIVSLTAPRLVSLIPNVLNIFRIAIMRTHLTALIV